MFNMEDFRLDNKVALVTGASSGIGFAIAVGLLEAGAKVYFNGRNGNKVLEAINKYKELGYDVKGFVCDVTNEEAVKELVKKIENENNGTIDILVNNAGVNIRSDMLNLDVDTYKEVLDIDLVGPFICSKAVIPGMLKKGHGKIINICSMMSEVGRETLAAYSAAKGGLKMLTKNIASEYGDRNIQCNGIGPGYFETDITKPLLERLPDGSQNPFDKFICSKTPAGRWGKLDELKGPAVFLASDASNFVNGQILYVDGGILAYIGKQPK